MTPKVQTATTREEVSMKKKILAKRDGGLSGEEEVAEDGDLVR